MTYNLIRPLIIFSLPYFELSNFKFFLLRNFVLNVFTKRLIFRMIYLFIYRLIYFCPLLITTIISHFFDNLIINKWRNPAFGCSQQRVLWGNVPIKNKKNNGTLILTLIDLERMFYIVKSVLYYNSCVFINLWLYLTFARLSIYNYLIKRWT